MTIFGRVVRERFTLLREYPTLYGETVKDGAPDNSKGEIRGSFPVDRLRVTV
jgi:hypothetical protein